MNKPKKALLATLAVLVLGGGGTVAYAATSYQPLLFSVGDQVVRTDDWAVLRPIVMNGMPNYTPAEEMDMLDQRSKEELVLAQAKRIGVTADESLVEKQLEQLGTTPEAQAEAAKQTGLTIDQIKNNYRRAMTSFQLKTQVTKDVTVTEPEIRQYYEDNKTTLFYAPEFRSIYYLRAKSDDILLKNVMQNVSKEDFPTLVSQYNSEEKSRVGAWHELVGIDHLASHTTANVAKEVYKTGLHQVVGPIEEGEWTFWFMVNEITEPKQFTFEESRQKILQILTNEKTTALYRSYLDQHKDELNYYVDPENLKRKPFEAFWTDLPQNIRLLFS
ncbi:peptidyl-prolyl cis-trans isomerase [Tumebacillus sp. DT12]|uniref:peptidylprolyl isomerase n=1 Tax=Tumebacillus lacus TaxID=2995335 RepID=A0ABT3X2G0_9BACL|nr:peptidyl-prolyl cis-trans isomerase [Tumebacillus lacus]MCX7571098.1 peptidyl-prolyl cis-trans isomerase [Tumebacillus lacus]